MRTEKQITAEEAADLAMMATGRKLGPVYNRIYKAAESGDFSCRVHDEHIIGDSEKRNLEKKGFEVVQTISGCIIFW